jgi:hypothetical protein
MSAWMRRDWVDYVSFAPTGLDKIPSGYPPLKRWAIFYRPFGTQLQSRMGLPLQINFLGHPLE